METKKVLQWNTRMSALYALGVWTMVGSYFYFKYTGKYDDLEPPTPKPEAKNPNEVVYQTAHTNSVIIYKKDFVPFTTRIMNFIESFTGGAAPGDRGNGK
ncbi:small integral membrane protein 26-like [Eucyclogobius newberryi]|uniref:small integral membrane protein 26-like n=1 Tax=Eucyclogobius newberryi TaxID=166745 RepID=UPI003B59146D